MKKYIYYFVVLLIVTLSVLVGIAINNSNKYLEDIKTYDNNFKALTLKADSLKNQTIVYQFNIEQLEYINDSIMDRLNATRKDLEIKDKNLKQLQYILSEGNIKDTVTFKDTIFRDSHIPIDTTLGDYWYSLNIKATSPSSLEYGIKYKSELEVYMYDTREYVGTPKKCFLGRLFQKKYNMTRVTVVDNNPYAEIKNKKFYFINKK